MLFLCQYFGVMKLADEYTLILVSKWSRHSSVSVYKAPKTKLQSFTETAECLGDLETTLIQALEDISCDLTTVLKHSGSWKYVGLLVFKYSKAFGWMCNTEKWHRKISGGILLQEFCFSMEYMGKITQELVFSAVKPIKQQCRLKPPESLCFLVCMHWL